MNQATAPLRADRTRPHRDALPSVRDARAVAALPVAPEIAAVAAATDRRLPEAGPPRRSRKVASAEVA